MGLEIRPFGVRCNISCTYCYQDPLREAGNFGVRFDVEAVKNAVLVEGTDFIIFGGEPLLVPKAQLEDLWKLGLAQSGYNGIQTNGVLIDEDHLNLFRQYKVHVGFSIDGPNDLNDARWAGSLQKTRHYTAMSIDNLKKVLAMRLSASVIVTLHRINVGSDEAFDKLKGWIKEIYDCGVRSLRLHALEVDNAQVREKLALSDDRLVEVYISLFTYVRKYTPQLAVDVFDDILTLLKGDDSHVTCVWRNCDPWTTKAVRGVDGDGRKSNCGRTNKEGIDWLKSDDEGFERYIALYQTPQEYGGCKDCRFWLMCRGQCPGTALQGDFRNRSEHCDVWKRLFAYFEQKLIDIGITPLSKDSRRLDIEEFFFKQWCNGHDPNFASAYAEMPAITAKWHVPVVATH
jgi:uncharacterized protein